MFAIKCQHCQRTTEVRYKKAHELPFDYDPGYFCLHCNERLNSDVILAELIMQVNKLEEKSHDHGGQWKTHYQDGHDAVSLTPSQLGTRD